MTQQPAHDEAVCHKASLRLTIEVQVLIDYVEDEGVLIHLEEGWEEG